MLYDYGARFYDPYITHFSQPDTIVPDQYNPLDWNRYGYARYNPLKYTDPTGHRPCDLSFEEKCDHGTWQPTPIQRYRDQLRDKFGWKVDSIGSEKFLFSLLQFSYSYERAVSRAPVSADVLTTVAIGFDILAWLTDLYAVGVVTAGGVFGAGVPAALLPAGIPEVPIATGIQGVFIAELSVQPVLFIGNIFASLSTLFSIGADIRDPRSIPPTASTVNSITLSGIGWRSNEAYLSFLFQSVAVANDFGWLTFPFSYK